MLRSFTFSVDDVNYVESAEQLFQYQRNICVMKLFKICFVNSTIRQKGTL